VQTVAFKLNEESYYIKTEEFDAVVRMHRKPLYVRIELVTEKNGEFYTAEGGFFPKNADFLKKLLAGIDCSKLILSLILFGFHSLLSLPFLLLEYLLQSSLLDEFVLTFGRKFVMVGNAVLVLDRNERASTKIFSYSTISDLASFLLILMVSSNVSLAISIFILFFELNVLKFGISLYLDGLLPEQISKIFEPSTESVFYRWLTLLEAGVLEIEWKPIYFAKFEEEIHRARTLLLENVVVI